MTRFYQGTMVNGDFIGDDRHWVFINWLYPGEKKFSAVKDVKRIEHEIKRSGAKGWYASSERAHTTMHEILKKMKAIKFREDEHNLYFMKEVM
jgi:hypothetical protein